MTARVCVGAVAGSFGVRGEVRLKSFCAEPQDIATYGPLTDETGKTAWTVKLSRPVKGGFAASLSGVVTKDAADALRGTRLYAPRDALPNLPDDEFYHADLIGLEVVDTGGARIRPVPAHPAALHPRQRAHHRLDRRKGGGGYARRPARLTHGRRAANIRRVTRSNPCIFSFSPAPSENSLPRHEQGRKRPFVFQGVNE